MKNIFTFCFLALIVTLLPSTALADFASLWTPPAGDKSIEYLKMIFGSVSTVITGKTTMLGEIFKVFNLIVLGLGSVVVSYTIVLSTINTAQEGEVMGRSMSSLMVPFRCAVSVMLLLPTASGYSLIQVLMMQFIVYGVAAADEIWRVVLEEMQKTPTVGSSLTLDKTQFLIAAEGILKTQVCQQVLNNDPACRAAVNYIPVSTYTFKPGVVTVGIRHMPPYEFSCGMIRENPAPGAISRLQWAQANTLAALSASSTLSNAAAAIYRDNAFPPRVGDDAYRAADIIETVLSSLVMPTSPDEVKAKAEIGWIFAGSYYFEMAASYNAPQVITAPLEGIGYACYSKVQEALMNTDLYLKSGGFSINKPKGEDFEGVPVSVRTIQVDQSDAAKFYQAITEPVRRETIKLLLYLTENDDDPISSLRKIGTDIISMSEMIWLGLCAVAFLAMLAGCWGSAFSPVCWALGAVMSVLVPVLTFILALLWGAGILIGLYLPLVPYLVFSFTAFGWFMAVVEAIVAAPVVALGLASPGGATLGKASSAVLILTNVFLRPSLMVIGLVIAIFLLKATINMVNFSFAKTLEASVASIGLFGCVAIICLYGGIVITIVHECFSLIYILPDKIIRWIGGQAEHSTVKEKVQEVKGAVEKGGEQGSSLMKGSAGFLQEKSTKGGGEK